MMMSSNHVQNEIRDVTKKESVLKKSIGIAVSLKIAVKSIGDTVCDTFFEKYRR